MGLVPMRPDEPGEPRPRRERDAQEVQGSGGRWVRQPDGSYLWAPAAVPGSCWFPARGPRLVVVTGSPGSLTDAVAEAYEEKQAEARARLEAERVARLLHELTGMATIATPELGGHLSGPTVDGSFTLVDDDTTTVTSSRRSKRSKKTSSSSGSPSSGSSSSSGSAGARCSVLGPRPGEGGAVDPAVERLRQAGLARSGADAELVAAAKGIVARARVLALRELEAGHRPARSRDVTAAARRTAVGEVEVALGLEQQEARTLLTAATVHGDLYATVHEALARGEVSWPLVRLFYEKTTSLDHDQRDLVAAVLMGTDASVAAVDRLDPDGTLHGLPWSVPRYKAALAAEVEACRGTDADAEAEARRRAHEARSLSVRVHDDGTATMYVRGAATSVVAAGERLDRAARALRAVGDPRTLAQLRCDIALGLLIYATIPLGKGKKVNPAPDGDFHDHNTARPADAAHAPGAGAPVDDDVDHHQADDHAGDNGAQDGTTAGPTGPGSESGSCCSCSCGPVDGDGGQGVLFDEVLAPAEMEALARAVNGQPPVDLQVVVPWATLAGGFPVCAHCSGPLDSTHPQPPHPQQSQQSQRGQGEPPPWARDPQDEDGTVERRSDRPGEDSAHRRTGPGKERHGAADPPSPGAGEDSARHRGAGEAPASDPGAGEDSASEPGAGEDSVPGRRSRRGRVRPDGTRRGGRGGVAEVLGPNPFFITDGHARELALLPGTTLHRLVTDPRDGRLVERTITAYEPDADMRRQVKAADVYSRAPGPRTWSGAGELDHVTPHGWAGGTTCETNLALLAKRPHRYKTDKQWHVTIGARRDLTFTTLLGQVATTRVHDYRTYLDQRGHEDLTDQRDTDLRDTARRDAANRLLHAALADPSPDQRRRNARRDWLHLDHTDPTTGRTRPGPHPDHPTLDDLLNAADENDRTQAADGSGEMDETQD